MRVLVLLAVLALLAAPLPYIGTEPYEQVNPELQVTVQQEWFITNQTSRFALNQTVVWSQPRRETWTRFDAGNWTFAYHMRILWLPDMERAPATMERPIRYTVNVTVTVQKLDKLCTSIRWDVSALDEQVGILFTESGSLSSWNQTARISRRLVFETPEYPVCGGTGDWVDWLAFFWPWVVIGCVIGLIYEVWVHWPRKTPGASSPAA